MKGLIEVVASEELYNKKEIDPHEFQERFKETTIMRFDNLKNASDFGVHFVHDYLIPNYGIDRAKKFPLALSEPSRDADDVFSEILNIKKPDLNREKWLVIPTDKYTEVQKYIDSLK